MADVGDRAGFGGHPANMHIWWGRTPISSTAAILKAALLDDDPSIEKPVQERLQDALPEKKVTVFDPFAGFGGIPLAAQRLGLKSVSGDLNPVAVMLNKAATEIPAQFTGVGPVHMPISRSPGTGAQGLAGDVEFYGQWMLRKAKERLRSLYPQQEGQNVQAWLWTRTVKCPNPACCCDIPLATTFALCNKAGQEVWVEPYYAEKDLRFHVRSGPCPKEKLTNKFPGQGARFHCPACGTITADEYVKKCGRKKEFGNALMAVLLDENGQRTFKEADDIQAASASVPMPDDVPLGTIPNNAHWFSPPGFGLTEYADLFTARQMTMLLCFSDLLREAQDKAASDALAAGLAPSGGHISQGGTGALAYGQAIGIYLAILVDMLADHNSTVCSWDPASFRIRNTFRRQAIPMTWNYAEANPFTDVSGNYTALLKKLVEAIASLPCGAESKVYHGDAVTEQYPQYVLVCTELPYFQAIGYAHLSDFFYIWLRRSLQHIYPELFNQTVTSKKELSTVSKYYGEPPDAAKDKYEAGLRLVCEKLYTAAAEEYPTLLIFAYRKDDEETMRNGGRSHWSAITEGILTAGFTVSGILPLWDSKEAEKDISARTLIICRKGQDRQSRITRRGFISSFKRVFPERLPELLKYADPSDHRIISMGCGMSILSEYKEIINADGSRMSARDALQIIIQEIDEYFMDDHTGDISPEGFRED
ncbi:MAG: DUF1156 domain-containing protein [Acidaminococcaceae bacterium]|nr:DUF1156 domain-containing protein [Acidaminococcaceae bacterium]